LVFKGSGWARSNDSVRIPQGLEGVRRGDGVMQGITWVETTEEPWRAGDITLTRPVPGIITLTEATLGDGMSRRLEEVVGGQMLDNSIVSGPLEVAVRSYDDCLE
jgi:hypothetical protein